MPHGYLRIDHPADYDADRPEEEAARLLEELAVKASRPIGPWRIPSITGSAWMPITDAIRCGDRISVEAKLPGRNAFIQFTDAPPFHGSYRITVTPHRGSRSGEVSAVDRIEGNRLVEQRHAMMQPYPLRYVVTTTAENREGTELIWRIAISDIHEVHEDSTESA